MDGSDLWLLRRSFEVARQARAHGNHPFGALLADSSGAVILESENTSVSEHDPTGHAEMNLVRLAGRRFDRADLGRMTIYSSTEPCAMCSGAIYWTGIGRVVYGLGEDDLLTLTGFSLENPTMRLGCRVVLAAGQRIVAVEGPFLSEEAASIHAGFWA